jgi:hypothetical protein
MKILFVNASCAHIAIFNLLFSYFSSLWSVVAAVCLFSWDFGHLAIVRVRPRSVLVPRSHSLSSSRNP